MISVIIEQHGRIIYSVILNQNIKVSSIPVVDVMIMQQIIGLLIQINSKQDSVKYFCFQCDFKINWMLDLDAWMPT